jgi:hypothetical protein
MVILHEPVEFKFAAARGFDFPEKECAERVALHQAIEELGNLLGLPNELSLNSR